MSIYSGFATRFQEQAYDHCIDSLLYVLQKRIVKFYQGEQADQQKFISVVVKLHQQMRNMQKNKYLDPKSSQSIAQLIKFISIHQQNIVVGAQKEGSIGHETDPKNSAQATNPAEQQTSSKKKMSLWVERVPKVEQPAPDQKQVKEEQTKKGSPKHEHTNRKSQDKQSQFKRTSLNSNPIFTAKPKTTPRMNLSREKEQNPFIGMQLKPEQERTASGLLNDTHAISYSKASFHVPQYESGNHTRSRKIRSINKSVNQIEHEYFGPKNDISDIIKEYIIKTKRSKKVFSRNSKHKMEYLGKINDF